MECVAEFQKCDAPSYAREGLFSDHLFGDKGEVFGNGNYCVTGNEHFVCSNCATKHDMLEFGCHYICECGMNYISYANKLYSWCLEDKPEGYFPEPEPHTFSMNDAYAYIARERSELYRQKREFNSSLPWFVGFIVMAFLFVSFLVAIV